MVLALLAGLGYSSYAFGRYVLSNKLFGNPAGGSVRTVSRATGQASAVTHHTDWKGTKPRVEVKVLPSDESGPTTDVSSNNNDSTPREPNTSPNAGVMKNGKRTFDDAPVEYSLGNEGDGNGDRPRRKRRKRRNSDSDRTKNATARVEASAKTNDANTPPGDGATSSIPTGEGDQSSISVAADNDSNNDSVIKAPRVTSNNSEKSPSAKSSSSEGSKRRSRRNRRNRDRNRGDKSRTSSPVPQPESSAPSGDGNGDNADISPVPQPE